MTQPDYHFWGERRRSKVRAEPSVQGLLAAAKAPAGAMRQAEKDAKPRKDDKPKEVGG